MGEILYRSACCAQGEIPTAADRAHAPETQAFAQEGSTMNPHRNAAADEAVAEHRSVYERACAPFYRCCIDPTDPAWRRLVHEIAKEIAEAESAILKVAVPVIRETFGGAER